MSNIEVTDWHSAPLAMRLNVLQAVNTVLSTKPSGDPLVLEFQHGVYDVRAVVVPRLNDPDFWLSDCTIRLRLEVAEIFNVEP